MCLTPESLSLHISLPCLWPPGSPADRPDCDEVLEINGRNLENASHQHIIQYIHQVRKLLSPLLFLVYIISKCSLLFAWHRHCFLLWDEKMKNAYSANIFSHRYIVKPFPRQVFDVRRVIVFKVFELRESNVYSLGKERFLSRKREVSHRLCQELQKWSNSCQMIFSFSCLSFKERLPLEKP